MGEGQGEGDRPEAPDEVGFYDTKTPQKVGRGSASLAGEVDGPNIVGNVGQQIQEVFESTASESADPLTDQRMPRGHREHAREYFDRFREGQ